ncbi:MAG: M48 family metalloprotease [Chloroflexota bacterium]|nr:M48 family metalloprotease [Chloroflexota bacterium]
MYGLRTMFLVVLMAGLMMVVGLAVAGEIGLIIMAVIALGINLYSYYNSHSMVPKMMGGQLVTAQKAPQLYSIVERAACQAKMPFKPELLSQFTVEHLEARCTGHCRSGDCPRHVPSVYIIDTPIPNAFATGRHPKHSAVAATTGVMSLLTQRELAGVMAHELAHVTNRDTLWSTIVASMAMVISAIAMIAQFALFMGFMFGGMGGRDNGGGAGHLAGALIVAIIAPIIAGMIQMAVSRQRELKADDTGARRCGDPEALAYALVKLEQGVRTPESRYAAEEMKTAEAANHMFIVNPLAGGAGKFFSTHPPTEQRVERLRKIGEEIGRPF